MKTKLKITVFLITITLFSINCFDINESIRDVSRNNEQDTVSNNNTNGLKSEILELELPVIFDSTNYLIFPISVFQKPERSSSWRGSYDYSYSESYRYEYNADYGMDSYYGNFSNLIFQNIKSEKNTFLTKKNIRIYSFHFLRAYYIKYGKQYILLEIKDTDSNKDKKIDYYDISSLYVCRTDGSKLLKLSPDNQNLVSWKGIIENGKLYFTTLEDSDNNNIYDYNDKKKLFSVDLKNNFMLEELNFLNK